jgi:hypothetical protein
MYGATDVRHAAMPHVVFVRVGATKVRTRCTVMFVPQILHLISSFSYLFVNADWSSRPLPPTAPLRSARAASARCA